MAIIIDGNKIANEIHAEVAREIKEKGLVPVLATILVGDNPASKKYVDLKTKKAMADDIKIKDVVFSADITQDKLLECIDMFNRKKEVDGILLQLPLPDGIDEDICIERIDPLKDVDGFTSMNQGRLLNGLSGLRACTPLGVMHMLYSTGVDLKGKKALMIGRSKIVGKPLSLLLLERHMTVTIAHSRTENMQEEVSKADVVITAIGKPEIIKGAWIKEGAMVIDVGTNYVGTKPSKKDPSKMISDWHGDIEFLEAEKRASHISPVPGGVGPMTIACLMANTLKAHKARNDIS
jgi:methylenetetrahydrofolate dehydrogenase (NADP+) / methenyltetrahydrofolate cyclohydrolase